MFHFFFTLCIRDIPQSWIFFHWSSYNFFSWSSDLKTLFRINISSFIKTKLFVERWTSLNLHFFFRRFSVFLLFFKFEVDFSKRRLSFLFSYTRIYCGHVFGALLRQNGVKNVRLWLKDYKIPIWNSWRTEFGIYLRFYWWYVSSSLHL